ncbi:MAG: YfhO family protein [Acidobacteria bacterium]|nr:YfhO family protein [Acidobacteriota bacterium]
MSRKADVAALAAVAVVVALAFADVLFFGKAFYARDIIRGFYPSFAALRSVVRDGAFPFWNPYFSGGQPLAANPAYAAFYPVPWLAFASDGYQAIAVITVLHYLMAAAGMFCLLRSLRLHPLAASFGAISFALGGTLMSLNNLLTVLYAMSWMPWLAFFTRRYFRERRRADFAMAALVLGLILLIGEQSMILQCGALVAVYAIYRRRNARAIVPAAALCAVALLVGLAQIVPALDHQRDSKRATAMTYADATIWSLPAARPLELLDPAVFSNFEPDAIYYWVAEHPSKLPWLFSIYPGLLASALIVAGLVRRIRGWAFVSAVSIVSYLVAIGRHGPIYPLLYKFGLRSLRYPEKFILTAIFVLTVFAAMAADEFLREARFRRTTFIVSVVLAAFAAAVLAFASSPLFGRVWGPNSDIAQIEIEAYAGAMTALVTAIGLMLILALRNRLRLCLGLLALFVLADLGSRVRTVAPRIDASLYSPPPLGQALAAGPQPVRIFNDASWELFARPAPMVQADQGWRTRNALLPEAQALWGIESALEADLANTDLAPSVEYGSLFFNARRLGHRDAVQRLLALAGVTHLILVRDISSADDPVRVLRFPAMRYYFADQLLPSARISAPNASRTAAFIDWPFAPAPGRVLRVAEHGNAIDIDVESAGSAALIMSITRHKYWRATIDGAPASLYAANVAFQGLTIPRGRHHVSLRYRNPLIVICGIVSLLTVAALLVIAVGGGLRSKESPSLSPH